MRTAQFYDEYNAVLDMPAEYYLDTIKVVFQDFALVNGTWEVDGELVRPQDIKTTALLTIEGELDDISGAGQTKAAHDSAPACRSRASSTTTSTGAGHYGIFSVGRWRGEGSTRGMRDFIASSPDLSSAAKRRQSPRPMVGRAQRPRLH